MTNVNKVTNPFGKPNDPGVKKVSNPFGPTTQQNEGIINNTHQYDNQGQGQGHSQSNVNYPPKAKPNNVIEKIPPKKNQIHEEPQQQPNYSNQNQAFSNNQQVQGNNFSNTQYLNKSNSNDQMKEELLKKEFEELKSLNSETSVLRTTVTKLPANVDVLKESGVLLGLNICPLQGGDSIPLVKYNDEEEIPRCGGCKAYINPFFSWVEAGDKWICNMCKAKNVTLPYFFESFDKSGQRKDKGTRPEISAGSYEFYATKSFLNNDRPLNKPVYVFCLDVSLAASQNGYLSSAVESIKEAIKEGIPYEDNVKVAIITYDTSVHFYNLDSRLTQPQMFQVNDSAIFLPLPMKYLLVNLVESKDIILSTLDMIQSGFNSNTQRDASKLLEALDSTGMIVHGIGGKVMIFHASHSIREHPRLKSTQNLAQDELIYATTDNRLLSNKGINFSEHNASVDLFIAAEQYINLVTLNQICDYTTGHLHFFKKFRIDSHYKNLNARIKKTLSRNVSLECVMRTRISGGYKISNFLTPVLISHGDLMRMSTLDEDFTFTVSLDFQQSKAPQADNNQGGGMTLDPEPDPFIYIQSALLYTHQDGTRRVRIHNLCMQTTKRISEIHENIDCEALSAFYMKSQIDKIFKTKKMVNSILSIENLFKSLITSVFSTMHSHTKELPTNLEYLPLYFCGILKNRVSCKDEIGLKLDIDTSNYIRIKMLRMNVEELNNFIYPKFYQIHHLLLDQSLGTPDENGFISLPQITSNHMKSMENDGIYLVDNGYALILYIKLNADSTLIQSFFSVQTLNEIKSAITENNLFNKDPLNQRLQNIVEYLRQTKTFYQTVLVVFETTDSERLIKECLIEDNYCPWVKSDFTTYRQNVVSESVNMTSRSMKR